DEFIRPAVIVGSDQQPLGTIKEGDVVICFNFRTDRCREITEVLTQISIPEEAMKPLKLKYFTMTEYDKTYKDVGVLFEKDNLHNTIGEVLSRHNKTQIRIAET